jgi:carbonic anhydrase
MNRFDAMSLIGAAAVTHWGYSGHEGPQNWGELEPAFQTCSHGKLQSPIDLASPIHASIGSIKLAYRSEPLRIVNNGHTILCNYAHGSTLTLRGHLYELKQFHFHIPSEHTINGKRYAMELHLVHEDAKDNAAVLGVLLEPGNGNSTIQKIWDNMPLNAGPERAIRNVSINARDLVPTENPYFEYLGSLTTPPCAENIQWIVLATPLHISREQIDKFHRAYAMNARPIQSLNQRLLLENG